jgi:hypothetical protein
VSVHRNLFNIQIQRFFLASATIGPLLMSIFSSLLSQLKASVEYGRTAGCNDPLSECTLQDTLIDVMGSFASALPDYQKVGY